MLVEIQNFLIQDHLHLLSTIHGAKYSYIALLQCLHSQDQVKVSTPLPVGLLSLQQA